MNRKRLAIIERRANDVVTVREVLDLANTLLQSVKLHARPEASAKIRGEFVAILSRGLKIEPARIGAALL